ncbi:MAG: hypothetical protein IMZ71_02630 [Chloroflexi bacterium]|nr:hypothetical protein [Chloroflexota bacterium]
MRAKPVLLRKKPYKVRRSGESSLVVQVHPLSGLEEGDRVLPYRMPDGAYAVKKVRPRGTVEETRKEHSA